MVGYKGVELNCGDQPHSDDDDEKVSRLSARLVSFRTETAGLFPVGDSINNDMMLRIYIKMRGCRHSR